MKLIWFDNGVETVISELVLPIDVPRDIVTNTCAVSSLLASCGVKNNSVGAAPRLG